jgi:hypothetical protein
VERLAVGAEKTLDENGSRQLGELFGLERGQVALADPGDPGDLLQRDPLSLTQVMEIAPKIAHAA